jgi:hypothetical protein
MTASRPVTSLLAALVLAVAGCRVSTYVPTISATPAATPSRTLVGSGWSLVYPAGWHYVAMPGGDGTIGYLANSPLEAAPSCVRLAGSGACLQFGAPPVGVILSRVIEGGGMETSLGPPLEGPPSLGEPRIVDGLPAVELVLPLGNIVEIRAGFQLPELGVPVELRLIATAKDGAQARSTMDELLASIRFQPAVVPLIDTSATRAAAVSTALAHLRAQRDWYACFPDVPGQSRMAMVNRDGPDADRLPRPLEATCSTQIAPTVWQVWKMTLRLEWRANAGYPPGANVITEWITRDGVIHASSQAGPGSSIPPGM